MAKNEKQTRQEIIDKRLLKAGWNVNNPSQVIQELDIEVGLPEGVDEPRHEYDGHLYSDYALLGKDGNPIAVIEAKKTSVDPIVGKEQARNYAEKIKEKKGTLIPFVFYTNGHDLYFWDTENYPPRKVYGFPTRDDLERLRFLRSNTTPMSQELINKEIAGRPYQIKGIRNVLEGVEQKKRKFLMVMATGTGKTRTCMALIDVLMRSNWVQRVLFLVDRIALQIQALDNFKEHLPNAPVFPKEGEKEFSNDRRIYCTTYPTMLNIIESDKSDISPFFFDLIVADESHRSIYNVYKNIFDYFDAIQLGLTATPKDQIDHNTFSLFNCDDGLPSFAYSYEEAVNNVPPYLNDFEVLKIRTKFQDEGINSQTISDAEKKKLVVEGQDLDNIDFEGTDLEKKVTNKGTNALIIKEFMEECIKDPDGVLPGKTIIFAMTQKHAKRLYDIINLLYPEYKGQLAEVIVSGIKGVHGKGGLLDRFRNHDMPRIAISVDMLDTGVDVREIVNLLFLKPVFSYTKFWQMIGRGTRVLDEINIKPWCTTKDRFLIIDCWENFEYFKMNPAGKELGNQKALPVRLFETRVKKLDTLFKLDKKELQKKVIEEIKYDIKSLPQNSVITLDNKSDIDIVENDDFWRHLDIPKIEYLNKTIAPVMRAKSGADFKSMRMEIDVIEMSTAYYAKNGELYETLKEEVMEKISMLPMSVNIVAKEKELIERAEQPHYWLSPDEEVFDNVIKKISPLMKFIDETKAPDKETKLDIMDILTVKEYVEFGPENEKVAVSKYREMVEERIQSLIDENPVLQKLQRGEAVTAEDIKKLAELLERQEPYITENVLQKIYDNKKAKFIQFIKHIIGLEPLGTFTETVSRAFDDFISVHNTFTEQQIEFLQTLKTFIIDKGIVEKKDLITEPFTLLHPNGIRGVFTPNEINEILEFAFNLVA